MPEAQNYQNIIIRMPNWLGDLVMATPVLANLRTKWPEAKITAMCQSNVAGLLKNDPHVNEIFSFTRPSGWIKRDQHRDVMRTIRHGDYDLGVLLTNSFSSAWTFWRAGIPRRIGYVGHYRKLLLTDPVPYPAAIENQHLVLTYQQMLKPLGIDPSDYPPTLYVSSEEHKNAQELLKQQGIEFGDFLIGVNPGAAFGSAKCWLPDRFKAVTNHLLSHPKIKIIFFGDAAGASLVNEICAGFPPERVVNFAGKTNLRQLIALIQMSQVFLTNDSGPMHIAAALGTPLVALFGSTSDVKTGPYNIGKVIHKHAACSPCYQRTCPIDFRCMRSITADEVITEIETMMKE